MVAEASGLAERFVVRRWPDPVVERLGFPVSSMYTEAVLLPILGPATTLCLRRMGLWAAANPNGMEVNTRQLARDLGLGDSLSRNAVMSRTLARLCQFDMAQWVGGELSVRTVVAPVPERHLRRLSPDLVRVHEVMVRRQVQQYRSRMTVSPPSVSAEVSVSRGLGVEL